MANFIDHRISGRVSREFRRVSTGRTEIVMMDNGAEVRNAKWRYKRLSFFASFPLLSREAQQEVSSAFYAANAQLLLFRFRDSGDFTVDNSPLEVPVGTLDPVQLTKRYTFGPAHADRVIQAVDKFTGLFDEMGNPVAGTLDNALGLFTPDSEWQNQVYTWSGKFSCWVRFASDDLDMTMHTLDIATSNVELVERTAQR